MRPRLLMIVVLFASAASLAAACSSSGDAASGTSSSSGAGAMTASGTGGAMTSSSGAGGMLSFDAGSGGDSDAGGGCVDPDVTLMPAGAAALLAPAYAGIYKAYDLGTPPGMPSGHLGGCAILYNDPSTLLLAGNSEDAHGAIYSIHVKRDKCGHIAGWVGQAQLVATTPYVDANLIYTSANTLLYTEWPVGKFGQLTPGASTPSSDTTLPLPGGDSPGGLELVPSYLGAKGELRAVGWPGGSFYHLPYTTNGALVTIDSATVATTLPNGPGGFAYVPPGSPGFAKASMILAEWSVDTVATYEVNDQGDPDPATRQDFFATFPKPWGAYFEPVTGDYLFLTWGTIPDRVFEVQGFTKPPPPPPPPN